MPNLTAVIQTNKGTIRVELLESDAPKTTENFITLAERVTTTESFSTVSLRAS
jgi:cyclophilin family peptidyl-prolyl cis-trans isomerase